MQRPLVKTQRRKRGAGVEGVVIWESVMRVREKRK